MTKIARAGGTLDAMPRRKDELSRIEIIVLSSLARRAMHVYELKQELRYKHVRWWAKAEHGHLYAAVTRLAKRRDIRHVKSSGGGARAKQVWEVTEQGRARIERALRELAATSDSTYFDTDLFLSGAFLLPQKEAVALLRARAASLRTQEDEARAIERAASPFAPLVGRLIMEHRVDHLRAEAQLCERAAGAVEAERKWGPFLGDRSVLDFIQERGAPLEK